METEIAAFVQRLNREHIKTTVVLLVFVVFFASELYWYGEPPIATIGKAFMVFYALVCLVAIVGGNMMILGSRELTPYRVTFAAIVTGALLWTARHSAKAARQIERDRDWWLTTETVS